MEEKEMKARIELIKYADSHISNEMNGRGADFLEMIVMFIVNFATTTNTHPSEVLRDIMFHTMVLDVGTKDGSVKSDKIDISETDVKNKNK